MRVRKLGFIGFVCALALAWGLPSHWRALGWETQRMPDSLAAAARPVTLSAQATRYEFVEHVIDYEHPCDDTFYPRATRSTAQATYDFTFRSDTLAAGCTSAAVPDGKITLNFPPTFTEGVSFTPGINVTGTFQLRVDAQNFTVRGYGLTVDTVIDRLPKREDPGVHQDLRNALCPLTRFRKNPPLNGGTSTAPGLNPFANNASCSVKAPDVFQSYEGNQVLIISTIDLVVGGDQIGPANFFNYTGLRLLRFTVTSKYRPATNSCPALSLQNGLAGPTQCPPAKLRVEAQTEVFASDACPVKVSARKADGTPDTSYNGTVQVSLAQGSTPKIGCLLSGNQQCAATLSLALEGGTHKQPLSLQTPEQELSFSVLKPGNPVLEGKALIKAESGNVSSTSEVKVKSPLDLKIDHIEVQQGVKQDKPGTLVQGKDLLIRVFISANTEQFSKYDSIEGITAELFVRGKRGDIANSPFFLAHGGFNKSSTPNEPFVFSQRLTRSIKEVGGDSLNFVLKADLVKEDQLSFEAKLNDVYPDRDPTNNFKNATPAAIPFAQSNSVTILYSRARLRYSDNSLGSLPSEEGLKRQMELFQLAYPISKGKLQFVDTKKEEVLTGLPTEGTFSNAWFWITNLGSFSAQAAVFFVDNNYFSSIGQAGVHGITIGNFALPSLDGDQFVFSGGSVCAVNATCGLNLEGHCGTLAHEIGHTYTLGDTYQNDKAIYSTTNPRRADATSSGNRVEPGSFSWFANKFSIAESEFRDFMGNNPNAWIDGQTWDALRRKLRPLLSSLQIAQTRESDQTEPPAQEATGPFVVIEGQIQKGGRRVSTTLTHSQATIRPSLLVLEVTSSRH